MDLDSLLNNNDRPAPEKRSSTLQSESRGSVSVASTPTTAQNGAYPGGQYALPRQPSTQHTPGYAPHSASQSQSRGLTPLHTPSQTSTTGQYPFPQQAPPSQSPASAHPSHKGYRSFEPQSATTPGARPSSHGFAFAHPSPSMGQYHQPANPHGTASLSPTPSSHHSQTPHSVRQSPLTTLGHPPPQLGQPPQPQHYHQSQPNTPLGPPQLPQRYSNSQMDVSSPYHSRTMSGASSGMVAGSPQHHGSINSIVESPSLLNRPSPQTRRTSDHRSSLDRERSVSVSPKTMIPPRSSSHGSRHSSQQELYSGRSSQQASTGSMAHHSETPGHVHPRTPNSQPLYSQQGEVPQAYSQPQSSIVGPPANGISLSSGTEAKNTLLQAQKMGMSHLLAPTQHAQELTHSNGSENHNMPSQANGSRQSHEHSLPPAHHGATPPMQAQTQAKPDFRQQPTTSSVNGAASHPSAKPSPSVMSRAPAVQMPSKRPAESEIEAPPSKRRRGRRSERPIWAQLSHHNPRAKGLPANAVSQPSQPINEMRPPPSVANENSAPGPQPQPPVEFGGWEKSVHNIEPLPSFTKAVTDHLWMSLEANADIGLDPKEGTIEIEAKIGTLRDKHTQRRCESISMNTFVLNPQVNHNYHFESEMNEAEHKNMNAFLNQAVQAAHVDPSRIKLKYEHIRETDHFQNLNDAGKGVLPQSAQRRAGRWSKDMKLRTSIADKDGRVTARIVKIKLCDDLHIVGVTDPYDIRISINLEVNLADRPDIDPNLIVNDDGPTLPARKKDRLSYNHLAYHVDLTRVDTEGMPPKYELELEVDANELRMQMQATKEGRKSRFTDVVDGFINNMTLLMRQPRQQ